MWWRRKPDLRQQSAINGVRALKTRQEFSRKGYLRFYLMVTWYSLLVWAVCYREIALRFFWLLMRIRQKYDGQTGFFIDAKASWVRDGLALFSCRRNRS
jgi:hypothetical protein